jgi:ribosome assembly protein YihI (activator of Der GTPase)
MINIKKKHLKEAHKLRKERQTFLDKNDAAIDNLAKQVGLDTEEQVERFWSFVVNEEDHLVEVVSSK